MKIPSSDGKSSIDVEKRHEDESGSAYKVTCSINIGHGEFLAKNDEIYFVNMAQFTKELDAFICDRSLVPHLEGTYDTEIRFLCKNSPLKVVVEFTIGDSYSGYSEAAHYKLSGMFEIDQGKLELILGELRGLA
ncbi:MAG: hypothetical protein ABW101_18295 [Candidatus Thiodiazotropha sp.]